MSMHLPRIITRMNYKSVKQTLPLGTKPQFGA
jgi:hypothetical protein